MSDLSAGTWVSENQLEFDLEKARAERDKGLRRVAGNSVDFLAAARSAAVKIAISKGTVTADDVRRECPLLPHHPNAWGAVFKDKRFKWTGQWKPSALVQRHGNMQRVWRLR